MILGAILECPPSWFDGRNIPRRCRLDLSFCVVGFFIAVDTQRRPLPLLLQGTMGGRGEGVRV